MTAPAFDDLKDLAKNDVPALRWSLKKLIHLERNPEAGQTLHSKLAGYRKLTISDRHWRVVWRVTHDEAHGVVLDVAEVWAVGARADSAVYAEMRSRVDSLGSSPQVMALSEVIDQLGRLVRDVEATPEPVAGEAVPPWLVQVLTKTVGLAEAAVADMSADQAAAAWEQWVASQS